MHFIILEIPYNSRVLPSCESDSSYLEASRAARASVAPVRTPQDRVDSRGVPAATQLCQPLTLLLILEGNSRSATCRVCASPGSDQAATRKQGHVPLQDIWDNNAYEGCWWEGRMAGQGQRNWRCVALREARYQRAFLQTHRMHTPPPDRAGVLIAVINVLGSEGHRE